MGMNAQIHPWLWATNARGVYQWWLNRSAAQVTAAYATNGNEATVTITIAGAQDTNTAVEVDVPATASYYNLVVYANGSPASGGSWRTNGQRIKVQVGTSVNNVQVRYTQGPMAQNGTYVLSANQASVPAPGVLSNASSLSGGALTAVLLTNTPGVTLSNNGGFSCEGAGRYTFTYQAQDTQGNSSPPATVNVLVAATDAWYDDFTRAPTNGDLLAPWVDAMEELYGLRDGEAGYFGGWTIANGNLTGASGWNLPTDWEESYGIAYYAGNWTNYSVEARISFQPGSYGGGVGGRLDPSSGTRYAAWVYPLADGSGILKLVEFTGWTSWSGTALASTNLAGVGTNWHTVGLVFQGSQITAYYDGVETVTATNSSYSSGSVSLDMWTWQWQPGTIYVDDVVVTPSQ